MGPPIFQPELRVRLGHGTTNTDAGVGIGLLKGIRQKLIEKAIN